MECYICSKEIIEGYLCEHHSIELYSMLNNKNSIVENPDWRHHCQICGRFEDRIIVNHHISYFCNKDIVSEYRRYLKSKGPLYRIIDTELSSVEFVRDYVQLRFDGPCLTAYLYP